MIPVVHTRRSFVGSRRNRLRTTIGESLDEAPRGPGRRRAPAHPLELRLRCGFPPWWNGRKPSALTRAFEGEPASIKSAAESDPRELVGKTTTPVRRTSLLDHRRIHIRVVSRPKATCLARTPVGPLWDDRPHLPVHAVRVGEGPVRHASAVIRSAGPCTADEVSRAAGCQTAVARPAEAVR